jgi:hypothetical protein
MGRLVERLLVHVHGHVLESASFGDHARVGVASQAVLVGDTRLVEHLADLVWRMTVDTGGDLVRLLLPQTALDYLEVYFLDPSVALRTGARDVVHVDAGARVRMRQDEVRSVTRRAHRGDRQTLLIEAPSVYG